MAGNTGVRPLDFAGFEASVRFLRTLDDEIWVARWDGPKISVDRPEGLDTAADIQCSGAARREKYAAIRRDAGKSSPAEERWPADLYEARMSSCSSSSSSSSAGR